MIQLADRNSCTGCSACANICSHSAILMKQDDEGFLAPKVDEKKCVECGFCEKHCPALHPLQIEQKHQKAYAMISYEDRDKSSSGGAFSVFARYVLAKDGVVFGAAMTERLVIRHIAIDSLCDLDKLRGSKYVQSEIGDSYKQAKDFIRQKRLTLFTGTPCQIAGLYDYLGKRHEDCLITLDLVCHGVPSARVFGKYLEKLKKIDRPAGGNIEAFRFRKLDSWDYCPAVKFAETKWEILAQERNAYMSAFFKGLTYRESCFHCQYSNMERVGTFTIADFWGIGKYGKPFKKNVASGVSLVIDNASLMSVIEKDLSKYAYLEERDIDEALHENHNLKSPVTRSRKRDTAIKDMMDDNISLREYAERYGLLEKENAKYYLKKWCKTIVYALGVYNIYKSLSYRIKQ